MDKPHYYGHRQRLRERFLKSGLESFPDYEAVELFLTLAIPYKDVKVPAKLAIERFGSLRGVLDAPLLSYSHIIIPTENVKPSDQDKTLTRALVLTPLWTAVAYRTRKERKLPLSCDPHVYEKPGKYSIMVKVIDIFGNDTSQILEAEVK